ncbi:hypothetical protein Poli38472_014353 [Pythium oligandrum]|uniref:WLGC domain-containing protein n=1 Tax=Pythium oligandrum TaxID=41045 RepID=A0A8K1FBY6_PYTOL|nr:hypothetical protein Poli38472_014353 [Pythium oligandrum]|eukprot:TMW57750.1 hypothetical protein Poli38472_014353 [Pythium oligandrum]
MQAVCSWARRFHQIFGPLGIVMLLVFAISGCWTVFLVTLSLFPNEVANYLMETGTLDRGNFWQLQKSNPQITGVSVFVLLFVALCYFYLFMTVAVVAFPSSSRRVAVDTPPGPGVRSISRYHLHRLATHVPAQLQRHFSKLASFHGELTMQSGRYRKIWNVFMEIPEIILQSISFAQYMYEGLQEPLVLGYAALMGLNCFIIFYNVEFGWRAHAFHEIVSDAILDVVFAVFFPAIVLFYSVNSFRGDLESIKLRQKYFPPQDFERSGQLYAEAEPIATFTSGVIINTGVQVFPPWTVDTFANLDTLHIEGKRLINNLVTVPANLFSRMSRLRTLYLVNHPGLIEFPSLVGLRSLETMYLTQIEQITAIPSLEGLPALKTFGFTSMPFLAALPELTPLKPTLKTLVIQTSALCCSGYLDPVGACNVSHPDCELPPWGFDSRRCLPTDGGTQLMISNASRAIIQPFIDAHKVCDEATSLAFQEERRAFVPGQQDECEGVLYRHCFAGICYNPDLQEVRCVNDSRVIAMRKEVIARGGDCDTDNEAWLGCGTS